MTFRRQFSGAVLDLRADSGVTDQSAYDNNGSYEGGMGVVGDEFVFDGVDDVIVTDLRLPLDGFSLHLTGTRKTSVNNIDYLMSQSDSGGTVRQWYAAMRTTGQIRFLVSEDGGSFQLVDSTNSVTIDSDFTATCIFDPDASELRVTLNGVTTTATTSYATVNDSGQPVRIGDLDGVNPFTGHLRRIQAFTNVLTAGEVALLASDSDFEPFGNLGGEVLSIQPQRYSGSGDLLDESGNSSDMELVGGASISDNVLVCDGTTGYAVSTGSAINVSDTNYSASVWVKPLGLTGDIFALGRSAFPWSSSKWIFRLDGGDLILSTSTPLATGQTLSVGEWRHIAFSMNTTQTTVYVDGELTNTFTGDYTRTGSGSVILGARGFNGPTDFLDCEIADARIFESATLTPTEIKRLYNNGVSGYEPSVVPRELASCVLDYRARTGTEDQSLHRNHGTYEGGAYSDGREFVLDGVDDAITLSESITLSGEFTLCGVITPTDVTVRGFLFNLGTTEYVDFDSAKLRLKYSNGTGQTTATHSSTSLVNDTQYHWAVVVDSTDVRIYINGVLDPTITAIVGTPSFTIANVFGAGIFTFQGTSKKASAYGRALTAGEVSLLASDPGFEPFGNFGRETLSSQPSHGLLDQSGNGNAATLSDTTITDGKFLLSGSSPFVSYPINIPDDTDVSFSVWVKPEVTGLCLFSNDTNSSRYIGLAAPGNTGASVGGLAFPSMYVDGVAQTLNRDELYTILTDGQEHHVAVTGTTTTGWDTGLLRLGSYAFWSTAWWNGEADDARVFEGHILTQEEVNYLYNDGSPRVEVPNTHGAIRAYLPSYDDAANGSSKLLDYSGSAQHGEIQALPWTDDTENSGVRGLLGINASAERITIPSHILGGPYSFLFYWKPSLNSTGPIATSLLTTPTGKMSWVNPTFFRMTGADGFTNFSPAGYTLDEWVSVLFVSDGTNISMYLNGQLIETESAALVGDVYIDGLHARSSGLMDDVLIYDRPLSQQSIDLVTSGRNIFNNDIDTVIPEIVSTIFIQQRSSNNIVGCL